MLTNDFLYTLNKNNIKRDYAILRFRKKIDASNLFRRTELLNQVFSNSIESISINSDYGYHILSILIRKNNFDPSVVGSILSLYGEGVEQISDFPDNNVLISLLLKTLNKYDGMNNISDSLYLYVDNKAKNKGQKIYLKVDYFNGKISLAVSTFTEYNTWFEYASNEDKEKVKTFYNVENGIVNVTSFSDPNKYVNRSIKMFNKNLIPFFSLNSNNPKSYKRSKVFYFNRLLKKIEIELSEYLIFEHKKKNFNIFKARNKVIEHDELIENKKYIIIDKTINSQDKVQLLYKNIKDKFPNVRVSVKDELSENDLNIIVVNEKEEYEKIGLKDQYEKSSDYIRQHVYEHSIKSTMPKAQLKAILIDLIIKQEVIKKEIELYDFKTKVYENWKFIKPIKVADKTYELTELVLEGNKLQFKTYENVSFKPNVNTELIIIKDEEVIEVELTKEFIIPDHDWINERYAKLEANSVINVDHIIEISEQFLQEQIEKDYLIKRNEWNSFIEELHNYEDSNINKKDLLNIIDKLKNDKDFQYIKKGYFGKLIEYIYEKKDFLIALNNRNAEAKEHYIKGFKGINYNEEKINEVLYYVAPKNMNHTLSNAIPIRKIKGSNKEFITEYLELLNTKVIRQGEASVSVLFLKYLNEYSNYNEQ